MTELKIKVMKQIKVQSIKVDVLPGCSIHDAADQSIILAILYNCTVKFVFNDRFMTVTSQSTVSEVVEEYNQKVNNKTL